MKYLIYLTLLLFTVEYAAGTTACRFEFLEFALEHMDCARNGLEIQNLVIAISKNKTTYDEAKSYIAGMCERANSTHCYNELGQAFPGPCNAAKRFQNYRNALRVVLVFNEFMCQNNGTKFLDFVKDGGASCYLHRYKTVCFKNAKIASQLVGEHNFADDTICKIVEADLSCHHHYEGCENPNVNIFYLQVIHSLSEKFQCS